MLVIGPSTINHVERKLGGGLAAARAYRDQIVTEFEILRSFIIAAKKTWEWWFSFVSVNVNGTGATPACHRGGVIRVMCTALSGPARRT